MTKEEMLKILGHQLKGIMFHADAMAVSCLNGYERLKRIHFHQAVEETENHLMTVRRLMTGADELISPTQIERIELAADATRAEIMEKWLDWETDTKEMYQKLISEYPECRLWMKLYKDALQEITRINYMI